MTERTFMFRREGDLYHPTPLAAGPWDPRSIHGRLFCGLIAEAVEVHHGDPAFQVSRLTTDLFRLAMLQPLLVQTTLVRDGNRIRVADASITGEDGMELARGSVVMLKRAAPPEGEVWSPDIPPMPHPDSLETYQDPPNRRAVNGQPFVSTWESRPAGGDFRGRGPKRAWMRERHQLVAGEDPSPIVRLALAGDMANPYANISDVGLGYVNADVSIHAVRDPVGEWIGLDTSGHFDAEGVAIGECIVHDVNGPLGRLSVCAVAQPKRP